MVRFFIVIAFCLISFVSNGLSQQPTKKANARPAPKAETKTASSEPFEKATVQKMAEQCVKLETEAGLIEIALLPESAPETVRNFLNLVAVGAFDTTTFSRVVPGFVVQGGNLSTREKITPELEKRMSRTIPDEPNTIKHERGVVSMARSAAPNSASSHFFILVGDARHLDGTFAAFGRVMSGMDLVDNINKMPVEGDKPTKPVRLRRATVVPCPAETKSEGN
ncbi:MAG: peptidylprolyl isomerase [Acidobacteriota bacterium]|nr:peptidylprolyl isomerase [Acidobacteriota bacterium]